MNNKGKRNIGHSSYVDDFILKGASLFLVWTGRHYRMTRDADLLGIRPADSDHLADIFRQILDAPVPRLMAYTRYSMVAEKLEAIIRLGMANSRMKDFFDVWVLCGLFDFDGETLRHACQDTFNRRRNRLPAEMPIAFTYEFFQDEQKRMQWQAFIRKAKPDNVSEDLESIVNDISGFCKPIIEAIQREASFHRVWSDGGPWRKST